MSNKMWGGRFSERPDAIMEEINVSIDVDRHMYAQDIAASKAHAAMLARQRHHHRQRCKKHRQGSRHDPVGDRQGHFRLQARARRHPYERREPACRADRPGRRTAAHRALAQRPGRDRFPALCPRHHRRDRCGAGGVPACAGDARAGACRHGHARLHPSADRAARDVRPSSAGLCRDGRARPRPLCRCAQAAERIPAGRCGAGRHLVSDRPHGDREGARLRPADGQFARCGLRSRFRAGDAVGGGDLRRAPVALRRRDRDLDLAAGRGSCGCPTNTPPAPRSCRRSATRTRRNWCAPRPAG